MEEPPLDTDPTGVLRALVQLGGVASRSALIGWAVKQVPEVPHVLLARGRKIPRGLVDRAVWHRGDPSEDCDDIATGKELTLAQCFRSLPFDGALAVADSARRAGELAVLARVRSLARGPGGGGVSEGGGRVACRGSEPLRVRAPRHLSRRPGPEGPTAGPHHDHRSLVAP